MKTMYLVIWSGTHDRKWQTDGLFELVEAANAKFKLETLLHPTWRFEIIPIEVPDLDEKPGLAETVAGETKE